MSAEIPKAASRCGFVAVLGAPNAGKSTLVNALVGAKVSIVTPKVQTTRSLVRGIAIHDASQIIFIDTPGIFEPRRRLDRAMVRAAWTGADDADIALLLFDASRRSIDPNTRSILAGLKSRNGRAILALNKIDLIPRGRLLDLASTFDREELFERIFMISATTGDGSADLLEYLSANMPEGPWLFPEDQLSDLPQRLIAAEITREKLFLKLQEEVPYALTVETESWEDFKDGSVKITQTIYVRRESQKAIVLGKDGRMIKSVRAAAQREMETLFERKVHLFLFVKVREGWQDDRERYRALNLDFDA